MYNHRSRGNTEKNKYPSDFFDCSTYTLAHQKHTKDCKSHYITTKSLRTLVLDIIRTASTFAISNEDEFVEKIRSASRIQQEEAAKDTRRKQDKDRKRVAEVHRTVWTSCAGTDRRGSQTAGAVAQKPHQEP